MRNHYRVLGILVLCGCATTSPHMRGADTEHAPRTDRADRIEADELSWYSGTSAWDALRGARPHFLDLRRGVLPGAIVDGTVVELEMLRSIAAHHIESMHFLVASDAVIRYGDAARGGLVVVTTKRGGAAHRS